MEVQALRFNELYTTYDNYLNSIYENITTFNYGFLLNSDIETIRSNYDSTIKYVTTLIYNYYYEYYLTSGSEDTFKRLHTMTMVSKLPYFKSLIDKYNNLINTNLDKTNGQENNATSNGEISRSGNSSQATTPQDLSNTNYIDDYSSSQQKYSSNNTDTRTNTFTSNNTGSISDTFKHIEDIPKRIFNEVISLFGKFFFSSELIEPYAELTIEETINKLNTKVTDLNTRVNSIGGKVYTLDNSVTQLISAYTQFSNQTTEKFTEVYSQLDNVKTSITDINIRYDDLTLKVGDIETTIGDINSILDNINGEVI